jgi:hypothetical protein
MIKVNLNKFKIIYICSDTYIDLVAHKNKEIDFILLI